MNNSPYLDKPIRSYENVKTERIAELQQKITESNDEVKQLMEKKQDLIATIEEIRDVLSHDLSPIAQEVLTEKIARLDEALGKAQYLIYRHQTFNLDRVAELQDLMKPGATVGRWSSEDEDR